MPRIILAAVAACLLLAAPASAAQSCMKWEDGVRTAAEFSRDRNDRIAAVLLTPEESAATWNALFPGKEGPHVLGVMVSQSEPDKAFIAGFDEGGCLVGSGSLPFGPVIDAMVKVDVQSTFVIIAPAPAEAPTEGA
mgnify:CR=1 FL=1